MDERSDLKTSAQAVIRLNPLDNVAIAKWDLEPGTPLSFEWGGSHPVKVRNYIPPGHKVALVSLRKGDPIFRYGEVIGTASQEIQEGNHVHTHNVQPAPHDRIIDFVEGGLIRERSPG